ncbi:hypothetical protein [Streptomyces sp. NPDC059783]|uniref:hypothetical protein n=1 Tax=Streptomyces sp. NPDC059783 TaxID=3346944 RepID=UPI0036646338
MNNPQYGAPQHELNVLSSLLRDVRSAFQLVDWNRNDEPQYWLRPGHFQTTWLGDAYEALLPDGLADIERRLKASSGADRAQIAADALTARMISLYQRRAATGDTNAQWAVNQAYYPHSEFWAGLHGTFRHLAQPTWPANPEHARHDAYVTTRTAQHPSAAEGIPFELTRPRGYDSDARARELTVIGAILSDPTRAQQIRYSPQSPDASPYWLQPQDFGDPVTAEIWDALITGPDPALALPEATDPNLTPQQRTVALIQHITTRLTYNDHHRSTGDPAAQARLDANANQTIGAWLAYASSPDFRPDPGAPDFRPNPDHAAQYAVTFILEPSISAAVEDLAGRVRDYGLSDASLGRIALELSTTEHGLGQLAERLDNAPRTALAGYSTPVQTAKPAPEQSEGQPSYTSLPTERRVLISLMQDPSQLHHNGPARSLAEQDFTQPEHRYLFKAIQSLPPDAAQDRWLLNNQAQQLARHDGAPPLDFQELDNIGLAARTVKVAPANQGAGSLVTMTVRRTARDASTAVQAAAQETLDPRALIDHSREQLQQATREALRYHEQSVPEPTRYNTQQANVA